MADEDPDKKLAKKIEPMISHLEQLLAKSHDLLRDIKLAVAGENPVAVLRSYYGAAWKGKYGRDYVWNWAADSGQLKRLLKSMTVEEIQTRMVVYLSDDDLFYNKNQHPFGLFSSRVNAFTPSVTVRAFSASGCHHQPLCKTDVEHTRRHREELLS
jgi:hypothetical protein